MPELPEVETIKLGLKNKIIGLKITKVQILNPKSFLSDPSLILDKQIVDVIRRGKVLGIVLDNCILLFHLKMSGQLIYQKAEESFVGGHPTKDMLNNMPVKSTRVIFEFSDGSKLFFNDQRKFGWIKIVKDFSLLDHLGPEPLEKEFSLETFRNNLLKHKNSAVKVVLLDQTVLVGVGNIYASEACFLTKVDPQRKVGSLSEEEIKRLHKSIIETLKSGIKYGGSTRTHFVNEEGKKGLFLDYAYVYNRQGKKCKICQNIILKTTLGGRGTFFCQSCQN